MSESKTSTGRVQVVLHVIKSHLGLKLSGRRLNWHVDVVPRYVSRRFVTTDGTQSLPAYFTADANLRTTLNLRRTVFTTSFFVENLTNEAYEIIRGYPVPPRSLRIEISMKFTGGKIADNTSSSIN